jgi:hypothetical protein
MRLMTTEPSPISYIAIEHGIIAAVFREIGSFINSAPYLPWHSFITVIFEPFFGCGTEHAVEVTFHPFIDRAFVVNFKTVSLNPASLTYVFIKE